ncbi:MAG: DUF167 domain-containing protein [Patescibacteria group bacterium]
MRLFIKVKAKARENNIEFIDKNHAVVSVTECATKGKANHAVCALLSKYLNKSMSKIILLKGVKSRQKTFEILD